MSIRLRYIGPNKWYHRAYNNYCLRQVLSRRQLFTDTNDASDEKPLFVTGFFRSGTSITTRILQTLGMDLGPENHLLLAKNQRAELNPDGFFENYIFMETSLMAFHKLNSWGHLPPSPEQVKNLRFDEEDRKLFAEFTLCGVHDDRISNKNKMDALINYDVLSLDTYFKKRFKYPYAVKNPHFAVLSSFLLKKWPHAKFLVCFREPSAAIASAAKITHFLDEKVYSRYYSELTQLPSEQVIFFSHTKLIESPEESIKALANALNLNQDKVSAATALLNPSLHRFKTNKEPSDKKVKELYDFMLSRAINK